MTPDEARQILDIDADNLDIKKAYRIKLLQYHPDKNRAPDACEKFHQVQQAYETLCYLPSSPSSATSSTFAQSFTTNLSYSASLKLFLQLIAKEHAETLYLILMNLMQLLGNGGATTPTTEHAIDSTLGQYVWTGAMNYLKSINRPTLKIVYAIFTQYQSALHIPTEVIEELEAVLRVPYVDEYVVLNPFLTDLFAKENVYKLKYKDAIYYVPLWHHDMIFEYENKDLVVKCFPILPNNMIVDELNHLHIELTYDIKNIWSTDPNHMISVIICGTKTVEFPLHKLRLTSDEQVLRLHGVGLPWNNIVNIFDCSKSQDILLHIRLELQ